MHAFNAAVAVVSAAIALTAPSWARAADAKERPAPAAIAKVFDDRHGHDKYYPRRGATLRELPRDAHASRWRGSTYYFHAGVWYRPARSRWVVVTPPAGLVLPTLPPFHTTIWIGAAPYYYANGVYYTWRPALGNYVVVEPPARDTAVSAHGSATQIYVYPNKGQNAEQQATDRYECHRWAVKETGFDPTRPADVTPGQLSSKRDAYSRATAACLQGRGYSVK